MEDPAHVKLNTSVSAMSPCVHTRSGPNSCCYSCLTVVSLLLPTCALQQKHSDALDMEERAMTNNDDGSYGLLSLPPFKGPLGVNLKG